MTFSKKLLIWYKKYGRKNLPWQLNRNAYTVWVSEIMLQQTQVKTVIPYYEKFMQSFADVNALANAHEDDVLHHWSGLGYYARARNLHKAAQQVRDEHCGLFPLNFDDVLALPGVGRSTAGAVLAQAEGQRHAILDGNVKRVLSRFHAVHGWTGQKKIQDQLWLFAEMHTPEKQLADYTQAIMDLGATLCRRSRPDCESCPLSDDCAALATQQVALLPTPKPKKTLPVKTVRMLLLRNDKKQILLEKRPPTGIWGGLWSLPEMPVIESVKDWCNTHYQFDINASDELPVVRHTFSHFHLDITPCVVEVNNPDQSVMEAERRVWYKACKNDRGSKAESQSLGLAAPVSSLLNRLNEE
ncbi:MAG: A/G-specific adenine glycosylase [endosymbiont of Galathealinum brachiosum]|uniref:Adenine DNA glycosylase n=1 Tax=endosymbiont of Galathealinum brachiosum TaxID=2200906 RepID=A0A370DF00_9GAMM|nr:MAG: A/G-specific adenine glycosylase [endosymbiont of Galathealinum brachiosum]